MAAVKTSYGTNVPANPSNQGNGVFSNTDLNWLYNQIDPGKSIDIPRITKGLPSTYTLQDLQQGANLGGLSSRSTGDWSSVMSYLNQALNPPTRGSTTVPGGTVTQDPAKNATGGPNFNSYIPPPTSTQTYTQGLVQGGPGNFTTGGGSAATAMENIIKNQGVKWDPGPAETNLNNLIAGGAKNFSAPQGTLEELLGALFWNPTAQSMSQGQIPPGIMAAFQDQLARSNAGITEGMSQMGNRYGSDLADMLSRNSNTAFNQLLAGTEDRALQALQQLAGIGQNAGQLYNQRNVPGYSSYANLVGQAPGYEVQRGQTQLGFDQNILNSLLGAQTGQGVAGMQTWADLLKSLTGGEMGQANQGLNYLFNEFLSGKGMNQDLAALASILGGFGTTQTNTSQGPSTAQSLLPLLAMGMTFIP
jgi:hypothetical protein